MSRPTSTRAADLATRSLYLTVEPTPRTLTHRTTILSALQSHGTIEHFRNLRHHPLAPNPAGFHTILSSPSDANRLFSQSPLRVATPDGEYEVRITPSYHDAEVAVKNAPLYGPWKPAIRATEEGRWQRTRSMDPIAEVLKRRIPDSIAKAALCDWTTDSPRERRAWFQGEGESSGSVPWRILRKQRMMDDEERKPYNVKEARNGEGEGYAAARRREDAPAVSLEKQPGEPAVNEEKDGDNQVGWDGEDPHLDDANTPEAPQERLISRIEEEYHWGADDVEEAERKEMERDAQEPIKGPIKRTGPTWGAGALFGRRF